MLETRFDAILPTLATKADLAGLRADLKADIGSLSRWMIGLSITMFLGFCTMLVKLLTHLPR